MRIFQMRIGMTTYLKPGWSGTVNSALAAVSCSSSLIISLANMGSEMIKLELQDTAASALFTVPDQPGFKYVVMPMRI